MPNRRHAWAAAAICVGLLVGVAGCGGPTLATVRSLARSAEPLDEVNAAQVNGLGTAALVDGRGWTLYLYVPDHHRSHSTCTAVCSVLWPPLLASSGHPVPIAGDGIQPSLLGVTTRPGGTTQVTYNGWPLYLYANDPGPGRATGEGDDSGLWYAISAPGNAIR